MMKNTTVLTAFIVFMACIGIANADEERMKIQDAGLDGDVRIYIVNCPDGNRTSVNYLYKESRMCWRSGPDGQKTCINSQNINRAGENACAQAGN